MSRGAPRAAFTSGFDLSIRSPRNSIVLTIHGRSGNIIDAVLLSDATSLPAAGSATANQAASVANAGQWQQAGGGVPVGGFVGQAYVDNAVFDLDATGATAAGTSIQRKDNNDTNSKADWNAAPAPSSFGVLNPGQTPF